MYARRRFVGEEKKGKKEILLSASLYSDAVFMFIFLFCFDQVICVRSI